MTPPDGAAALHWLNWVRAEVTLGPDTCDALVALGMSYPCDTGKVGDPDYASRRQTYLRRIAPRPETDDLIQRLGAIGLAVNAGHFGLDLRATLPPDYLEYRTGYGQFDWHDDYAYVRPDTVRKLTMIVQLSAADDYRGGRLEVFAGGPIELPRDCGAVVVFPAFVPHRVTPMESGVRRSLVMWFAGPPLR